LKSTGLKDDGETAQQHTEVFIYFRSLNCWLQNLAYSEQEIISSNVINFLLYTNES
jgi:hypothetical protein